MKVQLPEVEILFFLLHHTHNNSSQSSSLLFIKPVNTFLILLYHYIYIYIYIYIHLSPSLFTSLHLQSFLLYTPNFFSTPPPTTNKTSNVSINQLHYLLPGQLRPRRL